MKIYISGKITGEPNYKEKFEKAVHFLIKNSKTICGEDKITPYNPASLNLPKNATWKDYMNYDLKILLDCDAIYMLENWQESKGARLELIVAAELEKKIFYEKELKKRS